MAADIVKLNIGGTIFTTSESTLTNFSGLFNGISEEAPVKKKRSIQYFKFSSTSGWSLGIRALAVVANISTKSTEDITEIQKEAEYYQLNGLVQICSIALEKYSKMSTGNIVKLDVGGTIFKTSKSTLTRFDGFFKTMLETNVPITKDDSGAIFIDRSPKNFDAILQYLRHGRLELSGAHVKTREIQNEAKYYRLNGLVELCEAAMGRRVQRFHENFH